jgi:hypothetical protein
MLAGPLTSLVPLCSPAISIDSIPGAKVIARTMATGAKILLMRMFTRD